LLPFFPHIATPSGSIIHIHFDAVACEVQVIFFFFLPIKFTLIGEIGRGNVRDVSSVDVFFLVFCCDAAKLNIEEINSWI
jgi:hypothetical protein